ncbi:methyltransferase domain protein [delta proteobacterium NaphS2]|nr:methyltransferase domain protein [delta proteobacterium NaphS2]
MSDKKLRYWDSVAREFKGKGANLLWRAHSDAVNKKLVNRWLPPGILNKTLKTDLFDEAKGSGLYPMLSGRSRELIGMDISALITASARKNFHKIKGVISDIRSLPFTGNSIDLVISISTLDHFNTRRDIVRGLREIKRILRDGGQLIITLDNLFNPVIALRALLPFGLMNWLGIVPYYVGATMSPPQLYRTLTDLGFEVTDATAVMHCPRFFAVLLAGIFDKYAGGETRRQFLGMLNAFEHLAGFPTRFLTGYFIAVRAVKKVKKKRDGKGPCIIQ